MALLDLQGMELAEIPGGHSSHSKSCGGGGASTLSLLLC
ncbi:MULTISPECIES: SapB/AmfS family lanthipeptide [Actinomadura]|uniref:SapB/AmfS family lantipeptide n=1 Tax=Actinomadura alba TaxID=406431 RepID=A0ABR7LIY1_9ACTN|nr:MULTISPECIES: SapB/AmfS family lanthipeptide [Actinomadura]MBC6458465.1 SapB/AmfS family lantipeptide [Actinomadura sp. HBU206391]MBC6464457.1 SapB/AmfS family lantipeptide [Actinomadura alba]